MNCYKCKEPIRGPYYHKRLEGAECRTCHIIKVFGSLQAYGMAAGLGTKYEYSREYLESWGPPN